MAKETNIAYFAGGCFWCTEAAFDYQAGVLETISGYLGGEAKNANYQAVAAGNTNHFEALKVVYDPKQVNYQELLEVYWQSIDPSDAGGQFADRGSQYQTAIFYLDEAQKQIAIASKEAVAKRLKIEVATQILPFNNFYPAEAYHQDYHQKNKLHYNLYKHGSGRVKKLKEIWQAD